ncbi:MAG TPA: amidase [Stellaceae bacterium]|nr:amidase [Stellaceae bacterium]
MSAAFPTIAEAASLIAARRLSPVELTRACLDRIARLDGTLHSFLRLTEDRALAAARDAEDAAMKGTLRGPLHGIPIGLKDIYETKGIATTAHSRVLENHVPARDAACTRRLADAGTVLLGKLATHEFAFGGPSFDLPWPPARNPWNPAHFTGGSSSGTGAAVAAGLVLGGLGSDTGGSIRLPAALCGIAGIKPTYGLVSRVGIIPLAFSLDHAGPMAWTVEDCAILLQAIAGYDPEDPASVDRAVPDFRAALGAGAKGLRIGVLRQFHERDNPVNEATRRAIDGAVDFYRREGAVISDVTLSPLADWRACGLVIILVEGYAVHERWMRTSMEKYGELLRDRLVLGALVGAADYVQAQRRRRELCAELACAMDRLDIILTATVPAEAPPIDRVPKWGIVEQPNFTAAFNVTGYPAMSVCTGYGDGGLPLAMQLVAKPFDEPTLFRAAHAYERAMPWRDRRPPLAAATAAA